MRLERPRAATRRMQLSNSCIRCTCRRATGRSTRVKIPGIASRNSRSTHESILFNRTKCHGCSKRWLWEMPHIETFFLCLLLTGARRDEARLLKWAHLDLDRALWHKPTTRPACRTPALAAPTCHSAPATVRLTEGVFPSSRNSRNGMQAGSGRARPWSLVGGTFESK